MTALPEKIRAFIAVRIPEPVIAQLANIQEQLKREFTGVSWTRPESIHLTVRFLGHMESARVEELSALLRQGMKAFSPFRLRIESLGSFGNRVIWTGVAGDCEMLKQVAGAVRQAASTFGSHEEAREFNAHVMLGRFRKPARGVTVALRRLPPFRSVTWRVDHIELIRSELSPKGARYTVLGMFALQG